MQKKEIKIKEVINLPLLKRFIRENYGKKCKKRVFGCMPCQLWAFYEEVEAFVFTEDERNWKTWNPKKTERSTAEQSKA